MSTPSEATIKMNVLATCAAHGLPIEFAVYFLTMIDLAGGDYMALAAHPDHFRDTIRRISIEVGCPIRAEELPQEVTH